MLVRDGFIEGVSDYCDRWCEACPLASWCRVFADIAEAEAALDPSLEALFEARPWPLGVPLASPARIQDLSVERTAAADPPLSDEEPLCPRLTVAGEHEAILARARGYCYRVHHWLDGRDDVIVRDPDNPRAVVGMFRTLIPGKIFRALALLVREMLESGVWTDDRDGSAKVALIGIEKSHAAWCEMVERGLASDTEAAPFFADLVWLGEELERVFPGARAFVRPAFDEPDELARLLGASTSVRFSA